VLPGTPTQQGVDYITFEAANGVGSNAVQSFTLTVDAAPEITSADSATFTTGSEGSFQVTASGTPAPAVTEAGVLPNGVTFDEGTGVLSGTPTQQGVYHITFEAANGVGSNAVQSFTLTVDAAPEITSADSATFTTGSEGSFQVTASGTPAPTVTETGVLPNGVTFDEGTGVLSGTPTQQGVYHITFEAANGVGSNAVQSFTLTVSSAPTFTSADNATFTPGREDSFSVTASGTPAPNITETGALPGGVTFDEATGVLFGASTQEGVYHITFEAANGVGSNAVQSFTLTVGLHITTTSLPDVTPGTPYSVQLEVVGSLTSSQKWKVITGKLPKGLKLSASGRLSGTVKVKKNGTPSGPFEFTVRVADHTKRVGHVEPVHQSATATFTLVVS
jgi:hypothetical protein